QAVFGKDGKEIKKAKDKPGRDFSKDQCVQNALLYVGSQIGHPTGRRIQPGGGQQFVALGKGYYFLWSLERMAVAYGLQTVGKKDWSAWGAELILATQHPEGGWHGEYTAGGVDTCFALLFLRRANLALDLTSSLKNKVRDPGEVRLKRGGVGGQGLAGN